MIVKLVQLDDKCEETWETKHYICDENIHRKLNSHVKLNTVPYAEESNESPRLSCGCEQTDTPSDAGLYCSTMNVGDDAQWIFFHLPGKPVLNSLCGLTLAHVQTSVDWKSDVM